MKAQHLRAIFSLLVFLAACDATASKACWKSVSLEMEDIRQADAIFVGKLVRYKRISPGKPDSLDDYGLLTFRIDEVIKGNVSGDVQLYWWNSTFGVPKTKEIDTPVLIAAVSAKHRSLPLRGASATIFPTRRPDLLQLMQAPCSSPFILDGTRQNIDEVRMILRGKTLEPQKHRTVETDRHVEAHIERGAQMKTLLIALGSVIIVVAAIAMMARLRRRHAKSSR